MQKLEHEKLEQKGCTKYLSPSMYEKKVFLETIIPIHMNPNTHDTSNHYANSNTQKRLSYVSSFFFFFWIVFVKKKNFF